MKTNAVKFEESLRAIGETFFENIRKERVSLFDKGRWTGAMMEWCMKSPAFKTRLLRFVDVFPYLKTPEQLSRHIEEYFADGRSDVPTLLKAGAKGAKYTGKMGASLLNLTIRRNIEQLGRQFIIGEHAEQCLKNLGRLREQRFAFVVDVLGEAAVSETEADRYQKIYLDLLGDLEQAKSGWKPLPSESPTRPADLDWGCAPMIQVAVKCTSLYSRARPEDLEGSVERILKRLEPIYREAIRVGALLAIDMESYQYKDIILEVFRRLRAHPEFRHYPHLRAVLQSYLRDTDRDLDQLLGWSKREGLPISIRLVKGAYWDYEVVKSGLNGWDCPVWKKKSDTDAAFERQSRRILEHRDLCYFACASHNVRSISAALATARDLKVPEDRFEFQVLYGMAEPVRNALKKLTGRVRLYCPYGEMIPGMAYLVRRLLENTSNESFVRQTFVDERDQSKLLAAPSVSRDDDVSPASISAAGGFTNHPQADFTKAEAREAFPDWIRKIRQSELGKLYPLHVGGKDIETDDRMDSVNPNNPGEVIGIVCQAGKAETEQALHAAAEAFPNWRDMPPEKRIQLMRRAAAAMRGRAYELSAWQVLEVGKQWNQAYADVAEAIDFIEYYCLEMQRLQKRISLGNLAGEENALFYEPRGVAGVIAPWNFPLAISCGMCSAALVSGNCVVYKPSGLSSVIGRQLVELFQEAGLPSGVFNYLPGRSRVMGDFLIEHPTVNTIAFTGSKEVGLHILKKAAEVQPGQTHVKRVIAEMGGKNAIVIDDDADLDEAVPAVIDSAFGFQGQKCSACSRVIVLEKVSSRFTKRLVEAAKSLRLGPPEDPGNDVGALVDSQAQQSVAGYARLAKEEGRLLFESECPKSGFYCLITIVENIEPRHRAAQEEIFGPVLVVMKAKDFEQAIQWANSTPYALTGALFSRSPRRLEQARRTFRVGNLYLNRGCTGSMVGRQAFGGFKLSGVGSKAGGPDYLLQFMEPRAVTENTLRRGFAPESGARL